MILFIVESILELSSQVLNFHQSFLNLDIVIIYFYNEYNSVSYKWDCLSYYYVNCLLHTKALQGLIKYFTVLCEFLF
jgi:hypothetical protein